MTKEAPAEPVSNGMTQALENLVQEEILLQAACWNFQEKLETAKTRLTDNRQRQSGVRTQLQKAE